METSPARKRGRPPGQTRAAGAAVSPGRPTGSGKPLADPAAVLDEAALHAHLSQPFRVADPGGPTRYDVFYDSLRKLPEFAGTSGLKQWWGRWDVPGKYKRLSPAQRAACWRWLPPQ